MAPFRKLYDLIYTQCTCIILTLTLTLYIVNMLNKMEIYIGSSIGSTSDWKYFSVATESPIMSNVLFNHLFNEF